MINPGAQVICGDRICICVFIVCLLIYNTHVAYRGLTECVRYNNLSLKRQYSSMRLECFSSGLLATFRVLQDMAPHISLSAVNR